MTSLKRSKGHVIIGKRTILNRIMIRANGCEAVS